LIYEELDLPFPDIDVLPWTRAYHLLQTDNPSVLFTMSRTAAREELFQWVGPTHASRTFLITYEGSGIEQYDPVTQHDLPVVAVKSDVTQYAMQELGYPEVKIQLVDSNTTLFHMLLNKREGL
jgi:polar amino acid transport system substrate-binding protein